MDIRSLVILVNKLLVISFLELGKNSGVDMYDHLDLRNLNLSARNIGVANHNK